MRVQVAGHDRDPEDHRDRDRQRDRVGQLVDPGDREVKGQPNPGERDRLDQGQLEAEMDVEAAPARRRRLRLAGQHRRPPGTGRSVVGGSTRGATGAPVWVSSGGTASAQSADRSPFLIPGRATGAAAGRRAASASRPGRRGRGCARPGRSSARSTLITRGIAPGTSISRLHSSGTRSSPARARRPPGTRRRGRRCKVKMTLTRRSGVEPVARDQLAGPAPRVAARIEAASLASACTAPRTPPQMRSAPRSSQGARILPEPAHTSVALSRRAWRPRPAPPSRQRAERRPCPSDDDLVADWLPPFAAPGDCAPRGSSARSPAASRRPAPRAGAVGPSSRLDSLGRTRRSSPSPGAPQAGDAVGARDFVAGVGEPVRERTIVGEQDQAGRVGVEPPDRVQAGR